MGFDYLYPSFLHELPTAIGVLVTTQQEAAHRCTSAWWRHEAHPHLHGPLLKPKADVARDYPGNAVMNSTRRFRLPRTPVCATVCRIFRKGTQGAYKH